MHSGISKNMLKQQNRIQILRVIREHSPISRADIAQHLGLTRAAVTVLVNEMLDQQILTELDEIPAGLPNRKGRRKIMLTYRENYAYAMGIYVDADGLGMGLSTLGLQVMERQWFPCQALHSIGEILPFIARAMQSFLQNCGLTRDQLLGVGIGVMPSMFQQMEVQTRPDGTWDFSALCEQVEACLGIPASADHAARLFALTRFYHKASPCRRQLYVTHDGAGHYLIAHSDDNRCDVRPIDGLCLVPGGRELPGYPEGSVQAELSDQALRDRLFQLVSKEKTPALWKAIHGRLRYFTLSALLTAAQEESDQILVPLAEEALEKLVVLLHNLATLYHPQRICLFHLGLNDQHLQQLRYAAIRFVGRQLADILEIDTLGEQSYFLCGCAHIVQRDFFDVGGTRQG